MGAHAEVIRDLTALKTCRYKPKELSGRLLRGPLRRQVSFHRTSGRTFGWLLSFVQPAVPIGHRTFGAPPRKMIANGQDTGTNSPRQGTVSLYNHAVAP